jgi:hypothetical protein
MFREGTLCTLKNKIENSHTYKIENSSYQRYLNEQFFFPYICSNRKFNLKDVTKQIIATNKNEKMRFADAVFLPIIF